MAGTCLGFYRFHLHVEGNLTLKCISQDDVCVFAQRQYCNEFPLVTNEIQFLPLHIDSCHFSMCRYHYNVADTRLRQHVEKGNEDGLYISCVASAANLWALIMDAGTGFCSQVYELSAIFLHKVISEFMPACFKWLLFYIVHALP